MTDLVDRLAQADLSRALYARALESLRGAVQITVDGLEDEGDRVYLGSTNHADMLREAYREMDALSWDEIMEDTQPKTELASTNLRLQAELADAQAKLVTAREALGKARGTFEHYGSLHSAKQTIDGDQKSLANYALAMRMAAAIAALDAIKEMK